MAITLLLKNGPKNTGDYTREKTKSEKQKGSPWVKFHEATTD